MDAITLLLIVVLLILPLIYLFFNTSRRSKDFIDKINKIPGPKTLPIIGNALEISRLSNADIIKMHCNRFQKYGPICRTWLMNVPIVHMFSAEACEIVLSNMKHLEKSHIYFLVQEWLGEGLLTSKGAKWQKHRKMITPTFHFKILENFLEVMVEKSNILVKILEEKSKKNQVFNVFPHITNATLDIICETAMGTNLNAQENTQGDYVSAIYSLSELIMQRLLKPWLMVDAIYSRTTSGQKYKDALNCLHGFTERVIKERREARRTLKTPTVEDFDQDLGKKKRVAFLDLLLDVADKDSTLTNTDLRNEVDTFMFEGHDTTTAGISWTLYLLGLHPEIQEKAYQEIQDIFNGEDRPIELSDVNEMKYLERVIKESLRLYPSVPFFGRKTDEEFEVHGYTIPVGTYVTMYTYVLHRNPKYYTNPEEFNPDNFLPEIARDRHPYAYLPFSAGPRNCIGQKFAMIEEKTLLASILKRFKIKSVDKREDITVVSELILRPQQGINITLEIRK